MAVYRYSADSMIKEGSHESGTVVAQDKLDAYDKLRRQGLTNVHLTKLAGLAALLAQLGFAR